MENYPMLGIFLTVLEFFLLVAWISCLFMILRDIFRSRDMSGAGKAGWTFLVVILPLIGILLYLAVRGGSMHQRDLEEAAERDAAFKEYIRSAVDQKPAGPPTAGIA